MILSKDFFEEFELDLTGTCNLQCPLCSRNYKHAQHMNKKNIRPLSDIIKQLDNFPNLKRAFIAGQVSEPTLYPELINYLKYLKSRNIYVELFSNASIKNDKLWEDIAKTLDNNDQIHFTICGDNQTDHEKYRIGSKLENILHNKNIVQSIKKIDYCQFIRFEYNKDQFDNILKFNFTKSYIVESEGPRFINNKIKEPLFGVHPVHHRLNNINTLLKLRPLSGSKIKINCKSLRDKKIYIDQFGNESACYVHHEYSPKNIFTNDIYNYNDILNFTFDECWACSDRCDRFIKTLNLEFIC